MKKHSKMNILVTGSAGFIGSHCCEKLLKSSHNVIGIDSLNNFYNPALKKQNIHDLKIYPNFQFYEANILEEEKLKRCFEENSIDAVIHLAAYAGVRPSIQNPTLYYQENIMATLSLIEQCKKHHIKRFLFASSSSVYGNNEKVPFSEKDPVDHPISPYAATKKAGELMCYNAHHLYGIEMACIRFFTVYGPRQRPEMAIHKFTDMITKNEEIPVFNHGNCLRDYTYIDDIIQGIEKILYSEKLTFDIVNLGESKTISTLNLIKCIEQNLAQKAKLNLLPAQPGDVEKTFADISHAKDNYDYNPQFNIENGIKQFIAWYKNK